MQFFSVPQENTFGEETSIPFGVSWVDFDNNKTLDVFVTNARAANLLYTNNGDGTFNRITEGPLVNDSGTSFNSTWGDFNNDGNVDVFVANSRHANFLYMNNGSSFSRVNTDPFLTDLGRSSGCSWVDFDNDGYLDLFVANRDLANFLYRNNGDGTFIKIGQGEIVSDLSTSRAVAWADYDNDGDSDLFVANDGEANFLYQNSGAGSFTRITNSAVVNSGVASQSASWGDYDNDGDLDLFVANIQGERNRLLKNNGALGFEEILDGEIANDRGFSISSSWADFDNDGDLDMFVGNGSLSVLYINNGDGTFGKLEDDITLRNGARSNAWADYDRDGDLDLFTILRDEVLYSNLGNQNHWLNINCIGVVSNRSAIGAKVRVKAIIGGQTYWQMREISGQTGVFSQNSLHAIFGLGDAARADSIVVEWPSGQVDISENVGSDQFLTATEGQVITSVGESKIKIPATFALRQNYPNPFNPSTQIVYSLPASTVAQLAIFNVTGQKIRTLVANQSHAAGEFVVAWNGQDDLGNQVSSGVYFYRLQIRNKAIDGQDIIQVRKMILLK